MIWLLFLFFANDVFADQKTEAFVTTRYRKFSSSPLQQENYDNFLYLKHEISGTHDNFHWVLSPYILVSNSQKVDQGSDPIVTPIFTSVRQMNIETHYDNNPRTWAILDFQELAVEYSKDDFKVEVGRRILSLGNLKLFSVWNKFNPTAIALRPTWLVGVDQVKLQWQNGDNKLLGYGIFDQNESDRAQILIYDRVASPFQLSFLLAQWWQATTFGFSGTVDVNGWLVKLEALNFNYINLQNGRPSEVQAAIGVEHGFAQDWTLNLEFFTQSQGATNRDGYATFSRSPHQAFRGQYLAATELKWVPDPFYTFSVLAALSLIDQSSLWGVTGARQLNDNLELSLGIFLPQGDGELGPKLQAFSVASFIGVPAQIDLTLKAFF